MGGVTLDVRLKTTIVRRCLPYVAALVAIGLLLAGTALSGGEHPSRPARPAAREPGREDPGRPLTSWVTRMAAGPSTLVDARGHRWMPDTGHVGGQSAATSTRIEGTSSQAIYQHERWGMRAYVVPVPATATYAIKLYLAETTFSNPRERVFDVTAEGVVKASDVDIVEAAGKNHAYHVGFTAAVSDGQLDLGFVDKVDRAKVNAIEVAFLRGSTAAPRRVWSDEFNGPRNAPVDRRRWGHETGGAWGDGELQSYTSRTANAYHDGRGRLVIMARAERFRGDDSITRNFTSARISTKDRYALRYGTFEARLQTPAGRGIWPAFWALGNDIDRSGWPRCGEIDVMEVVGHEPAKTYGTIHGPRNGDDHEYKPGHSIVHTAPLSQAFHTYGVQWLPGGIQFYFDGRPYGAIAAADLPAGSRWVFDHPFYLVLNVAVGGRWAGSPDASTTFPQPLRVDYVRVYQ
jgi:hypothetical protein